MSKFLSGTDNKSKAAVFGVAIFSVLFYFATQFSVPGIIGGHDGPFQGHQFLFHILYLPFSLISDPVFGAKLAAVFFASLASICFLWILLNLNIRYWWFWMILFWSGSEGFLFRIQMPRVQSLALVLLLLTLIALMESRKKLLFVCGLLFVWLYDGFFILFGLMLVWLIGVRWSFKNWRASALIPLLLGILAGTILNPYFPGNFEIYFETLKRIVLHPFATSHLPAEWHPPSLKQLITENWVFAFFKLVLIALNVVAKKTEENQQEKLLGITALFFLALLLFARRFIEYFPPFLILYFAAAYRDIWPALSQGWRKLVLAASLGVALAAGILNVRHLIYFLNH